MAGGNQLHLRDMPICINPKKGLHNVRSFIGACNSYWRHINNFTYSSAPVTDRIRNTDPWRWIHMKEACFQELKKEISSTNQLGVPRPKGKVMVVTDACDGGRGGTLYQWQELNSAELYHCQFQISGLYHDGTLKHDYPANEWHQLPLGHWNCKWN